MIKTDYLRKIYTTKSFKNIVNKTHEKVKEIYKKNKFDAIAFSGTSGAALAYPLSYLTGIPLICVRKFNDNTHFSGFVEGFVSAKKYLIVDDFIESGETYRYILNTIEKETKCKAKPIGILLYNDKKVDLKIPVYTLR